jgi:tetratricopeptide (TPR) repeat protein
MAQHAGVFQQFMLARRFRSEIEIALKLDPRDVQALRDMLEFYLLAPGLAGGDPKKAEAEARRIGAIDAAEGFLAQARIAGFHKDRTQMEAMLRRANEVRPPSYKAAAALAEFYLDPDHRNDAGAMAVGRSALGIDSGRAGGYCVLAAVYAGRGDWNELDAILTSAAREVPDDAAPHYRAAERLILDRREPARADRYLRLYLAQEAEGNQPTAADAHWKLGLALRMQGMDANAINEWKLAAQLDPDSPATRELKRARGASAARAGGAN